MKSHRFRHLFRLRKQSLRLVLPPSLTRVSQEEASITAKIIGWTSLAIGVAALGVFVGREIRVRYKFNHRTPYDYYSHSADRMPAADYGMGI